MPTATMKTKKTAYKRKNTRKRYARKNPTGTLAPARITYGSGKHFLSPKYMGTFPYADTESLALGVADIPTTRRFRLTSLHDPDFNVGGHQPRYHDEIAAFYSQYRVLGAKMKVVFSLSNPTGAGMTVAVRTSAGTGNDPTSHVELLERPDVKHVIMNSEKPSASLTCYYSAKKTFQTGDLSALTAQFGFSPSEEFYGNIHTINTFPGSAPQQVNVQVYIDYIALCSERKQVTAS